MKVERERETLSRGSGMQIPDGFPGFTIETSFGTGLVSERVFSNHSTRKFQPNSFGYVTSFFQEKIRKNQKSIQVHVHYEVILPYKVTLTWKDNKCSLCQKAF